MRGSLVIAVIFLAAAGAAGACGPRARTPAPAAPADPFAWLPADAIAVARAPAAGVPMLAFLATSPRRPACVEAELAGVRESFQLQRAPAERQILVAIGAVDRGRLEACGALAVRVLFDLEVTARREGPLTIFEVPGGGAQVAGFAGDRVVLADTAEQVRWGLAPPRAVGPADPLGRLRSRLSGADLALVTTVDHLAPITRIPARGIAVRVVRRPALRADTRVIYADPAAARRALDALTRTAGRDGLPGAIRQALALVAPTLDGAELRLDLAPLFAPQHAALLDRLTRELAALPP